MGELVQLLMAGGGAGVLVALVRQLRLWWQASADRRLARYVFDQTKSTEALGGYTNLLQARRTQNTLLPQKQVNN